MPITITPIQVSDVSSAIHCIQTSFDDDPYNKWVFDKRPGKFNVARNTASLKAKCEWGMSNALFFVAKDPNATTPEQANEVIGVGMWMKPRPTTQIQTWDEWWSDYMLWFKQGINVLWYQGWGGLNTKRYWTWKREQAVAQSEIWDDPNGYYFCNIVTVLPGHQGKGIGRKLFDVVTDMADREGRKCYLESSRWEPNVQIYEKMGFKVMKKMVCREDESDKGCDLFCMVREPKIQA